MNKEETIEAIKVMQAFVDGETITSRPMGLNDVKSPTYATNPEWDWFSYIYEVKPKPRELWVGFRESGRADHCIPIDKPDWKHKGQDYALMREVTE